MKTMRFLRAKMRMPNGIRRQKVKELKPECLIKHVGKNRKEDVKNPVFVFN